MDFQEPLDQLGFEQEGIRKSISSGLPTLHALAMISFDHTLRIEGSMPPSLFAIMGAVENLERCLEQYWQSFVDIVKFRWNMKIVLTFKLSQRPGNVRNFECCCIFGLIMA